MAKMVIAFAGSGDTTLENATALLDNNLLTEDAEVKDFYLPARISAETQPGLANVTIYLRDTWGGDEPDQDAWLTAPASKLVEKLALAAEDGHDPVLVVIVGDDEVDDETAALIAAAQEAGIPVKDLAGGLDDVAVSDDSSSEQVAPEPEHPAERPVRRRRSKETPAEDKAAEAASGPRPRRQRGAPRAAEAADEPKPARSRSRSAAKPAASGDEEVPWKSDAELSAAGMSVARATEAGVVAAQRVLKAGYSLEDIRTVVSEEVRQSLATMLRGALVALEGPPGETIAFIKDADGGLRKRGTGRPRTGEEVVYFTEAEARRKGLID